MNNTEIEIKLKAEDPKKLIEWLKTNAIQISSSKQTDLYFDPPHKSYIYYDEKSKKKTAKEYIRVRIDENKNFFCYKYIDKDRSRIENVQITEIETAIDDPVKLIKLLETIGFTNSITIIKYRTSYSYKHFQIDVDIVQNLGKFVEIEYKGTAKKYSEGYKQISLLLKEIGIEDWEEARGGYVELILNQ